MKSIKKYIMYAAVFATAGFGLSSCDIDMLPLNEVVLENFWTNKDDVESVVNSCYASATKSGYINDLLIWGECRSDNVGLGNTNDEALKFLLMGSIKTTNAFTKWADMYEVINRCNTVLVYAPEVAKKDPNYTESDLKINIAECSFLRAYSYLTLIKTFKNVPYTSQASIDDTQEYCLPQTKFEDVLDSLIADIESCKDYAPRRYSIAEREKNTGRVTRGAMYALLAELYLWRASDSNLSDAQQDEYYKKCIDACDYVLNYKLRQYEDNDFEDVDIRRIIDKEVYNEYGYPLLAEERTVGVNENGPEAYNSIFGEGGSFETIFELKFNAGSSKQNNSAVTSMFGTSENSQKIVGHEKLMEKKPETANSYTDQKLFSVPSDYRAIATFRFKEESTDYNIYKYVVSKNEAGIKSRNFGSVGTVFTPGTRSQEYRGDGCPNWILYRLSEIMLFRAEAEIELAFHMNEATSDEETPDPTETTSKRRKASVYVTGNSLTTAEELKTDAFDLISAVYRRSNPAVKTQPKYAPTMPENLADFRTLLMNERRREFLFEGKRYYDLVRQARREGKTDSFRAALSNKYGEAGQAVAIKMQRMDFMYMPVNYDEMKVNPNLVQNECYLDEIENIKN